MCNPFTLPRILWAASHIGRKFELLEYAQPKTTTMRALLLLGSLLLCSLSIVAQDTAVRSIGTASSEYLSKARPTSDGGQILAGSRNGEALLVKLDSNLTIEWSKSYGGTQNDNFQDVAEMPGGGYACSGNTASWGAGSNDYFVVRTDASGNLLWAQAYGSSSSDLGRTIDATSDGHIVITGRGGPGPGGFAGWTLKLDNTTGNVIWSRAFGANGHDNGYRIRTLSDGNILVIGSTWGQGAGLGDGNLLKIAPNGSVIWQRWYGNTSNDAFYDAVELSDGSLVMTGYHGGWDNHGWVVKTDSAGIVQWAKAYDGTGDCELNRITELPSGDLLVGGYAENAIDTNSNDAVLMKLSAAGDTLWSHAMGSTGTDGGFEFLMQPDSNLWVMGNFTDTSTGNTTMLTYNVGTNGTLPDCFVANWHPTITTLSISNWQGGSFSTTSGSVNTASPTVNTIILTDSILCGFACEAALFGDTLVCAGDTVSLSATAVSAITTQWTVDGQAVTAGTTLDTLLPAGTHIVGFIVNGSNSCADSAYITVTVNALPATSISASNPLICIGDSTTLSATGGTSYTWAHGGANPTTVGPASSQWYSVTVAGSNGCTAADSIAIAVLPPAGTGGNGDALEIIGSAGFDYLHRVRATSDGGYALVGSNNNDAMLQKLDSNLAVEWTKSYGGTQNDNFQDVVPVPGGGFACIGNTASWGAGSNDYFVVRTDASGNHLWSKAYGTSGSDLGVCIDTTSDGQLIVSGRGKPGPGGFAQWTLKLDISNGNIIWNRAFGGNGFDIAYRVRTLSDGNIMLAGMMWGQGAGLDDGSLLKFDVNGNIIFRKWYGNNANDGFFDFTELTDGSLIMTGYHGGWTNQGWVLKTDALGQIQWAKGFDGSADALLRRVAALPSGELLVGGWAENVVDSSRDATAIKLTATGDTLWAQSIGGTGSDDGFEFLTDASDNVWFYGNSDSLGFGDYDMTRYLPGTNGTVPDCHAAAWHPTVTTLNVSTGTAGSFNSASGSTATPTPTVTNITLSDSSLCGGCVAGISGSSSGCVGDSMVFVASCSNASAASWLVNGQALTASLELDTSFSIPGNYSVSFVVAGTGGCTDTASIDVTVYALANLNAMATPDSICLGDSTSLSASGANVFVWSNGVSTDSVFAPFASQSITVTATDTNGCSANDTVAIVVHSLPTTSITSNSDTVCLGDSVTLSAATNFMASWTNGVTDSQPFAPAGTTTYTVTVTDTNGCSITDSTEIVVLALPTALANASADSVCLGDTVLLTGSGTPGIAWDNGIVDGVSFTPMATHTYVVTGTDASGCINTDSITVTSVPLPLVVAAVNVDTICEDYPVSLAATGADTYLWSNGVANGQAFVPGITTTLSVTGTSAFGCNATDSITIVVHPSPTVVANASSTSLCAGDSLTLWGTGALTYSWFLPAPANGVAFVPSGTQFYAVWALDSNGCSNTDTITVVVDSVPVASVSADANMCLGGSTTLTASGGNSYSWSPATGLSDAGIANPVATPVQTTTYEVAVGIGNCADTAIVTVTVSPLPTADGGADVDICPGESAPLLASGGSFYTWSPITGLNNAGIANPLASPTQTTTYSVIVTDSSNCTDTANVTVTVNPAPTANAGQDTTICDAGSLQLNGSGGFNYLWSPSAGLSCDSCQNPMATVGATVLYTLQVENANGCTDTDVITITVEASVTPSVTSSVSANPSCPLDTIVFSAVPTNGGPTPFYNWTVSGQPVGNVSATYEAVVGIDVLAGDTVYCEMNGSAQCSTQSLAEAVPIAVQVHPEALVEISGVEEIICNDAPAATLEGTPSGGTFSGPGITGNVFNPALADTSLVDITYSGIDANGCSYSAVFQTQVSNCIGIFSIGGGATVELFPNPTRSTVLVQITNGNIALQQVDVLDALGQLVESYRTTSNALHIDLSEHANGWYTIRVVSSSGINHLPLLKQ